jgi:hypothetical protein
MKFSDNTRAILKNFSQINNSLLFRQGTLLRTMTEPQTLYVEANIAEEIPREFAIYDMNQFLSALSLFNDPDLDIQEKFVRMSGDKMEIRYRYCDATTIVTPPERGIKLPNKLAELTLEQGQYQQIKKAAATLNSEFYWISVEKEKIRVGVGGIDNTNTFEMEPASGSLADGVSAAVITHSVREMAFIPGSYTINIFGNPKVVVSEWNNEALSLRYVATGVTKFSKFQS